MADDRQRLESIAARLVTVENELKSAREKAATADKLSKEKVAVRRCCLLISLVGEEAFHGEQCACKSGREKGQAAGTVQGTSELE